MAVNTGLAGQPATEGEDARSPDEVAAALDVDPAVGLTAAWVAELLAANGPNALPEEKPKPGWRRFLEEYRSYMQIILVAAVVVSLVIKEWSTAVLLASLTVLNAEDSDHAYVVMEWVGGDSLEDLLVPVLSTG